MKVRLPVRQAILNRHTYEAPAEGRTGKMRLDFNENTSGCSPQVLERLRNLDGEALARYPERDKGEAIIAKHLGVSPEELLLTNGTDEAIHLICETYLEPEHEAIVAVPTFAMYEIYAGATGARVVSVQADSSFRFPTEGILAQIIKSNELTQKYQTPRDSLRKTWNNWLRLRRRKKIPELAAKDRDHNGL